MVVLCLPVFLSRYIFLVSTVILLLFRSLVYEALLSALLLLRCKQMRTGINHKMNTILYFFLVAFLDVNAQSALPAVDRLPSPPVSVVSSEPAPLGNAAVWQQAVTLDAATNITGTHANQYFYSSIAWWQSLENSSNSYLSGLQGSFDAGPYMSQLLQVIQNYPTRYDQAQASDPNQTPSK